MQNWFEDKHKKLHPESTSSVVDKHKELNPESASFELVVDLSDSKTLSIVPKSSQTPEGRPSSSHGLKLLINKYINALVHC